MRARAAFLAIGLACASAGAVEIRRHETRIDVGPDGAASATTSLVLEGAAPGRLRVPLGGAKVEEPRLVEAPTGTTMAAGGDADAAWIEFGLPEGVPAAPKLAFTYRSAGMLFTPVPEPGQKATLPEGSRLLRHRFVNTQEARIGHYAVTVRFPEAAIAHRINEQLPRVGRKEFVPRVELDRFEGRQGARLQASGLRQGDRTSMELEIVGERRSLVWLLLLVPLAGWYLFAFRDLVAKGERGFGTADERR